MVEDTGSPCGSGIVATAALRSRCNVGYRFELGILRGIGTTVTGRTTGLAGVIHCRWRPSHVAILVAAIALTCNGNMGGRLGQRIDCGVAAVVATRAIACCHRPGRSSVTHRGWAEGYVVVVTDRTLSAGRNEGGRLAQCRCAIMTGGAFANRRGVVRKGGSRPSNRGRVTGVALRRGCNVGRGLNLGIDGEIGAAMAGRTVIGDVHACAGVVHLGRCKSGGDGVTNVA